MSELIKPQPPLATPAVRESYVDPVFWTTVKRLTDARAHGLQFITGEYSTMTPFNSNNSRLLLIHQSGFGLYDGMGNFLELFEFMSASSEPRWSRDDPTVLYFCSGNQLLRYDSGSPSPVLIKKFKEYSSISGRGESDLGPSDGLVLCGDDRYVFIYKPIADAVGPSLDTKGASFDSLYLTPDGNVLISWNAGGIILYDQYMQYLHRVAPVGGHMDVTRDTNGDEVLIWTNSADPNPPPFCHNGIVKIHLADGQQTCLLELDWSLAVHVSCPDAAGWALIETYAPSDPSPESEHWKPYTNEIPKVKLDGSGVERICHHRSVQTGSYNAQPKVSCSRDGSRFVFASNFGQTDRGPDYCDTFLVELNSSEVPNSSKRDRASDLGPASDKEIPLRRTIPRRREK